MLVFGRIILHKRQASAMNSGAVSVSELSTTVDAMTKLQSSDTIVVTTLNAGDDDGGDATKTKDGPNGIGMGGIGGAGKVALTGVTDKMGSDSIASDIDLKAPLSIPSISNRNNVSCCCCFYCRFESRFNKLTCCPLCFPHSVQQQHLYSTYTPSTYGNLEPNSISYALVAPDLYNGNQTMTLHSTMMRPAAIQSGQSSAAAAANTGLYNHTLPHNFRMYFNAQILFCQTYRIMNIHSNPLPCPICHRKFQ